MRSLLVAGLFSLALVSAQPPSRYPAHWWTPVPEAGKPDWEILPQSAKPGEVIVSKRNELGILSNFAATPFTLKGKRYASIEGFWQMMLYPENASDPRAKAPGLVWRYTREEVGQMTSFQAKDAGSLAEENMQKMGIDWVTFEGSKIPYRSMQKAEHYRLICAAMQAKLEQNPEVRKTLLSTGNLVLRPDHVQERNAPPEWFYCQIWMEIRNELQSSFAFDDEPKFTVAGVTDHSYVGGHGSEPVQRSAEELTATAAALNKTSSKQTEQSLQALVEREQLEPGNASLHNLIARADENLNHPVEAVREYQRAAKLDPTEANLFDWGTDLLVHQAPQPALEVFNRGIHLFPLSSRMLLGSAVALYVHGDYRIAAQRFFAASDLNPADPQPYLFLGQLHSEEITSSEAFVQHMRRFVTLQPQSAWANYYCAVTLWTQHTDPNDIETVRRVESLLLRAIDLDPKLAVSYLQLGILCAGKQDFSAAIRAYEKAISIDPSMEQAHYRLAQAYRQIGETQKAKNETAVFHQLSESSAQQLARERSELQRFVVHLKSPSSN